jgi:PKD repeat protein
VEAPLLNVSFTASEDLIYTGQPIVFTDNTKIPTGFRRRNYEWDFGDGVKSRGTIPNEIQHSYSKPGVYEAKLCYNNGSVCSKPFSIKVELEEEPLIIEASDGLTLKEKNNCADPVFEEGTFSLTLKPQVRIDLTSLTVFANTGGSVTISLVEGGEVLSTIRRRVAQSTAGSSLPLTQFPDLDAGKTYTLQLRTEGGVKLQNIATCSPDLQYNNTKQLKMEYNAKRYAIFDLKYNY